MGSPLVPQDTAAPTASRLAIPRPSSVAHSYGFPAGLGDVRRFEDGNTLVTWSTAGQLEESNHDRDVLWRLNIDELGAGFAYVTWLESFYGAQ